ncbi:DUF7079 family protein [Hirschia baltica]|uniref:DUF7079 domain-containing protein n=1 Tax=Hirschia baltica (strain ATCC 49814 / DSM 5838 / IFAM 1418) TaxID=582402 RepID=C6XKM9_HIRBI|nr:hypothetical protein [Hirschia baltica]ACT59596.1 hypothetical protein Hbal_1911 [Hirschia baltica ATCC 49814]
MLPPEADLEKRQIAWVAMHVLFLDADVEADYLLSAAQTCAKTDYSLKELEQIFWNEVYPAMRLNIWSVAGEWCPLKSEDLTQIILRKHRFDRQIWLKGMRRYPLEYWEKLKNEVCQIRQNL